MKFRKLQFILGLQSIAIIGAAIWFFVYVGVERHPQPVVLVLGWFLLIPIALIRLVAVSMPFCALCIPPLLVAKKFELAVLAARYIQKYRQWLFDVSKFSNTDNFALRRQLFTSQATLASCLAMTDRADEEIELRKEIVEQAESLELVCDAAKSCDTIAWRYSEKKDSVHTRHWAERAIHFYEGVADGKCRCLREHKNFRHKHAALEATLAILSLEAKHEIGAEKHARNAVALISECSEEESEVTMLRLLNYTYDSKNFEQFEELADRYLKFAKHSSDKSFQIMKGKISIRRGVIYSATPERRGEAESLIRSGIAIADQFDKKALREEGQKALAALKI